MSIIIHANNILFCSRSPSTQCAVRILYMYLKIYSRRRHTPYILVFGSFAVDSNDIHLSLCNAEMCGADTYVQCKCKVYAFHYDSAVVVAWSSNCFIYYSIWYGAFSFCCHNSIPLQTSDITDRLHTYLQTASNVWTHTRTQNIWQTCVCMFVCLFDDEQMRKCT